MRPRPQYILNACVWPAEKYLSGEGLVENSIVAHHCPVRLNLSTTAKMAAVTAGRTNRRKSRRIASACAFLSNISLDGNIVKEAVERKTEQSATKRSHENVARNTDLLLPRRTLLHSISEPSTSKYEEGSTKRGINRQRSVTETICEGKRQDSAMVVRRSVSVSESQSTDSTSTSSASVHRSKHRISCLMGSSFHHKRRANDKR